MPPNSETSGPKSTSFSPKEGASVGLVAAVAPVNNGEPLVLGLPIPDRQESKYFRRFLQIACPSLPM